MKLQDINPQDVHDALDARLAAVEGEAGTLGDIQGHSGTLGDTRENLEADVREWCEHSLAIFPEARGRRILEWLDRQAAITERECRRPNWEYCETCEAVTELQAKVDDLTEERDDLLEQVDLCERCDLLPDDKDFEKTHMRLPVDADGVPIRPGDMMTSGDDKVRRVIAINENSWIGDDSYYGYSPRAFRHVQPDTVESLLEECAHKCALESNPGRRGRLTAEYAERIRRVVEHG